MSNSLEPFLIMSDYAHDLNSKWPPLKNNSIAKIEHNLIDLCYIDIIVLSIPMFYHIRNSTEQFPMMPDCESLIIL